MSNNPALNRFSDIQRFLNRLSACIGLSILRPDFRFGWIFWICISGVVFYTGLNFYSLYYFANDIFEQLQTVCVNGLLITGIQKVVVVIMNYPKINGLYDQTANIFRANASGRRQELLNKSVTETWQISKIIIFSTVLGNAIFTLWPAYQVLYCHNKVLLLNVVLPFVDHTTISGYATTSIFHYGFGFCGIIGNLANDLVYHVLICSHRSMVDLLADSLNTLGCLCTDEMLADKDRKAYLRNILISFQEADNFIMDINQLMHGLVICQVVSISFSMVLSLFCIMVNNWYGGYGYMIFLAALFLSMCYIGTILQTSNNKLCYVVYASSWYKLPIEDQRKILMLLIKTQNATELWIGPIAPLNVESGLAVLRAIYQIFMMMLEFVKE